MFMHMHMCCHDKHTAIQLSVCCLWHGCHLVQYCIRCALTSLAAVQHTSCKHVSLVKCTYMDMSACAGHDKRSHVCTHEPLLRHTSILSMTILSVNQHPKSLQVQTHSLSPWNICSKGLRSSACG